MGNYTVRLLFLCLLILKYQCCYATLVTFFQYSYSVGKSASVNASECSNIPLSPVGSFSTKDHCARIYDEKNCTGSFVTVLPGYPVRNVFTGWVKRKVYAKSVKVCPNLCERNDHDHTDTRNKIQIFNRTRFTGWWREISVEGCTKVPDGYINDVASIKTNNECIRLYNTVNCSTKNVNEHSIELSQETPFHHNLGLWQFPDVKAISFCDYNCPQITRRTEIIKNQVVLYERENYGGQSISMNVSETCAFISNHWTSIVNSIAIGNDTCVNLFTQEHCSGSVFQVNMTISNLSSWDTPLHPKSLQLCTVKKIKPKKGSNVPSLATKDSATNNKWFTEATSAFPVLNFTTSSPVNLSDTPAREHSVEVFFFNGISVTTLAAIVVGLILLIVLATSLVIYIKEKCKYRPDELTEKELEEFFGGSQSCNMDIENHSNRNSTTFSTENAAQNRPYNDKYEIQRSRIEYDSGSILDKSECGVYFLGTFTQTQRLNSSVTTPEKISVIVKTSNPIAGQHGVRSLMKEVKTMLYVGKHPNVAQLLGCCTENLRQGKLLLLMEFCSGGSLQMYLQNYRSCFSNLIVKDKICNENKSRAKEKLENATDNTDIHNIPGFDTLQLIQWCADIAKGMQFLSNAKIIHSDLASRNVLLTDTRQAKISDYGLCRQLYGYSRYIKTRHESWRWMSLESLRRLEFSTKSDVWSFGVVCWEIFALGDVPYKNIRLKETLLYNLEDGLKLTKPNNTTNEIYVLMLKCWENDPVDRTSFTDICTELEKLYQL